VFYGVSAVFLIVLFNAPDPPTAYDEKTIQLLVCNTKRMLKICQLLAEIRSFREAKNPPAKAGLKQNTRMKLLLKRL
jgi:hypothetical protein